MKVIRMKSMIAGIFIFLLPLVVSGQMFLLQDLPTDKTKLGFHYLRPDFKWGTGISLLSGVYDFSLSIPISSKLSFVGSIPFATLGADWEEDTEGCIGDIYIGIQKRLKSSPDNYFSGSLGIFLPTMPEDKEGPLFVSIYSDYYQLQKYFPQVLTIYGNLAYHHIKENDFIFGGEFGPNVMIPTKGGGDMELYIHYALTAGYRLNYVDLRVELRGFGIITEEVDDFGDRFLHDLAFGIHVNRGRIRPGAFYKIYLKESMREYINGVFGLKVEVIL